jgi:hypothetical protein
VSEAHDSKRFPFLTNTSIYMHHRNLKERDHAEDLGVDGRIILEWILGKYGGKVRTGFIWLRYGLVVGSC